VSAELLEEAMKRLVSDAGDGLIVLDLADVSFMDSTGLRAVLVGIALCVEHKRELELLPGPDQVQRLFEISGLTDELPFTSPDGGAASEQP
jgi:anti-sigma B factor antagonist